MTNLETRLSEALRLLHKEVGELVAASAAYIPYHNANRLGVALGRARAALSEATSPDEPTPKHSTEDDFRHFLSYEKLSGQPAGELARLRLAYYAGADAPRPEWYCVCGFPLPSKDAQCTECAPVKSEAKQPDTSPLAGCGNWKPKHGMGPYCDNCGFHESEHRDTHPYARAYAVRTSEA